jgi:hypothetical protein
MTELLKKGAKFVWG